MVARSLPVRASGALTPASSPPVRTLPGWWVALNLIGYQVGWLVTVYGATHGLSWLGPVAVLPWLGMHLALSSQPAGSATLLMLALAYGAVQETMIFQLGLVVYPDSPGGVPFWMIALWPLFATTLSVSLRWFRTRAMFAVLAGALLGPLAYWAGAAAGALVLPDTPSALAALSMAWGVAFPVLLRLASWLEPSMAVAAARN